MPKNTIPQNFLDLFQKRAFANLVTLMPDGSPQVTPVWVDYDGAYILVNSTRGRQKDRNMQRDKRVALSIQDPDNPYRYLQVRGQVVEITEDGAVDHINKLAKKYRGLETYDGFKPGMVRQIYKIKPEHVTA